MKTMTNFRKSILIGMTVFSLGGTALTVHAAEPAPERAAKMEQRKAKFAEHMAKRQAVLHDKLKLTAAQEPAWKTFIADMKPPARGERPDRAAFVKMSAPQRMEAGIERQKNHLTMQESRLASLKTFYAALTPDQQKVFDESLPKHPMGGNRGHRGHGGPGQHGEKAPV